MPSAEVDNTLNVVRWAQLMKAEQAFAIDPDGCTAVSALHWKLCLPIRAFMMALDICDYDLDSEAAGCTSGHSG
jgi:hypothetical protein